MGKGEDYRGKVFTTRSRLTCQQWWSKFPHDHRWDGWESRYCLTRLYLLRVRAVRLFSGGFPQTPTVWSWTTAGTPTGIVSDPGATPPTQSVATKAATSLSAKTVGPTHPTVPHSISCSWLKGRKYVSACLCTSYEVIVALIALFLIPVCLLGTKKLQFHQFSTFSISCQLAENVTPVNRPAVTVTSSESCIWWCNL